MGWDRWSYGAGDEEMKKKKQKMSEKLDEEEKRSGRGKERRV